MSEGATGPSDMHEELLLISQEERQQPGFLFSAEASSDWLHPLQETPNVFMIWRKTGSKIKLVS